MKHNMKGPEIDSYYRLYTQVNLMTSNKVRNAEVQNNTK